MIIGRVKVTDWRGIQSREIRFLPGLNILRGENEAGKSTLIDAIRKALYWDHSARRQRGENEQLKHIIPTRNPDARPTVELDLILDQTEASIVKVVSDDRKHCRCTVRLREPGKAEEVLQGEPAEQKIRDLLKQRQMTAELDWSDQSSSYAYLNGALPGVALNVLSINGSGAILPSQQLESVRRRIKQQRDELLIASLKPSLVESARSGTLAYELRQSRAAKQAELARSQQQLLQVGELRHRILKLDRDIVSLEPQFESARQHLLAARERQRQQRQSATACQELKSQADGLGRQLEAWEQQLKEIERLGKESATLAGQRQALEIDLRQLEPNRQNARRRADDAKSQGLRIEGMIAVARQRFEATTDQGDLLRHQSDLDKARREIGRLERLQGDLDRAAKQQSEGGPWPTGEQIGRWRRAFAKLSELKRDASTQLQITFDFVRPFQIEWAADDGPAAAMAVTPDQPGTVQAVRSLRLRIADVGTLQVNCGAQELAKLLDEIKQQTSALDNPLTAFGLTVNALPDGFDRIEELRIEGEDVTRTVTQARARLKELEQELGNLPAVRGRLANCQQQVLAAQTRLEQHQATVHAGLDAEALSVELDRLKVELQGYETAAQASRSAQQAASGESAELDKQIAVTTAKLSELKARVSETDRRLNELQRAGGDRDAQISQLRVALAGKQNDVTIAEQALASLGVPITDRELAEADKRHADLTKDVNDKRRALAEDRREVQTLCGNDPQGEVDRLQEELADLDRKLKHEERRLAGLALLDRLFDEDREKLARLIAGPLNERISPWLRQIRGVPTEIEIDPETCRIARIITDRGAYRDELPFSEHSEGTKQQLGLLVRVTLARLVAERDGGQHFVILDDPLTETSPARRPEMFRILSQAAGSLQILFVTCHADTVSMLDGNRLDL